MEHIIRAIEVCYKADVPCMLWGGQGIGKSEIVAEVARRNKVNFRAKHLAQLELGDLVGLTTTTEDRTGDIVTEWARPSFFPPPDEENGIFFADEFNRINEVEMRAMFEFVLNKKLNQYELPFTALKTK